MPREPRQPSPDEIEETIDENDEVDEASYGSFPASDPPAWTISRPGPISADEDRETGPDE